MNTLAVQLCIFLHTPHLLLSRSSPCNHNKTGIDVCGARVVKMVLEAIQTLQEKGRKVSKLSFIGYSLGGLILR